MRLTAAPIGSAIILLCALWLSGCRSAPAPAEILVDTDLPRASLTPPHEVVIPPPPAAEPVPPAVGRSEAVRQIYRVFPRGLRPLRTPHGLPIALYDLDADTRPECIAVAGPAQGLSDTEFRQLADPSRLFEEGVQAVAFHLVLFAEHGGAFEPVRVLALGDHLVFDGLRATPLDTQPGAPLIATVGFLTLDGKELELLVFDDASGTPRYRRRLSETLTSRFQLADIDRDGTLDLVLIERAMEEGTGYETFLTWYRWKDRSFREYRTTNVVRNLNSFLGRVQEQLLNHRVSEFLAKSLHPGALERLRKQGLTPEAIVVRTLGLEPAELPRVPEVREIVYPPILENPFTSTDREGWFFELSFRIVDSGGGSYIATTRLYMLANPFTERQFALAPPVR